MKCSPRLILRVPHIALIFTLLGTCLWNFSIDSTNQQQEVKKAHEMIFHAIFIVLSHFFCPNIRGFGAENFIEKKNVSVRWKNKKFNERMKSERRKVSSVCPQFLLQFQLYACCWQMLFIFLIEVKYLAEIFYFVDFCF